VRATIEAVEGAFPPRKPKGSALTAAPRVGGDDFVFVDGAGAQVRMRSPKGRCRCACASGTCARPLVEIADDDTRDALGAQTAKRRIRTSCGRAARRAAIELLVRALDQQMVRRAAPARGRKRTSASYESTPLRA